MSTHERTRKRAVELNLEARDLLNRTLVERWQSDERGGKLTRETRAELLGVSVATSERILAGKGVDRSTLTLAFKNLSLAWDDAYCQSPIPQPATAIEPDSPPPAIPVVVRSEPLKRRGWRPVIASVAVVSLLCGGLWWKMRPSEPSTEWWAAAYNQCFENGMKSFHRGDFKEAHRLLDQAIFLAKDNDSAASLAGALRFSADLSAAEGSFAQAGSQYREALAIRTQLGQFHTRPAILEALGDVETRMGDYQNARTDLLLCLKEFSDFKDPVGVAMARRNLGTLAERQDHFQEAQTWYEQSLKALEGLDKPDIVTDLHGRQATLLIRQGQAKQALPTLQACLQYWTAKKHPRWIAVSQMHLGASEAGIGNFGAAVVLLSKSKHGFDQVGDRAGSQEAARLLENAMSQTGSHVTTVRQARR